MPKLQVLGLAQLIYRAPLRDSFSFMIIRFCQSYKANSKSLFSLNILYSKSLFSLKILHYWGHYLKGQNDLFLTVRKPIRSCGKHVAKILQVYDDSHVILVVGDTLDTLFVSRISPQKWYSLITLSTQYSVVYYQCLA